MIPEGRMWALGRLVTTGAVLVLLAAVWGAAQELVQPGDLEYLGAFRLPGGDEPPETFAYGGNAMSFHPGGDPGNADAFSGSLFVSGHDRVAYGGVPDGGQVAEVSIPAPVISSALDGLPTASFIQDFSAVAAGYFTNLEEIPKMGMEYLDHPDTGPLIHLCWGQHIQPPDEPSHAWFSADLESPDLQGVWFIGDQNMYSVNGYMFQIPQAWAEAHAEGRVLATGRMRDGGQGGMGPALFAYRPWLEDGSAPPSGTHLAETTLLLYENADATPDIVRCMNGYQHPDEWEGGAWITTASGKSALLFAGTKSTGTKYWYGYIHPDGPELPCVDTDVTDFVTCRLADGSPCPAEDFAGCCNEGQATCVSYRGWWSTRFDAQLIFFDPADLAQVAAGEIESWQPQPYASLDIDQHLFLEPPVWDEVVVGWGDQRRYRIASTAFDRSSGLLYVLEQYADGGKPVVHVWRVNDESTPPTAEFTFSPQSPQVGETVYFTDASTGSISAWAWDFGDGESSTVQNPSHAFAAAGEYTVTLSVSGPAGSDQISHTLTLCEPCEATPDDPGAYAVVVAAAAHAAGLEGSAWVTDVELHAPGEEQVTASLFFLPQNQDNSAAVPVAVTVPAGGAVRLEDVVTTLFGADEAVGAILVGSDQLLLVSSRTYNNSPDGTFGQYIPGLPVTSAVADGEEVRLIQLTHTDLYRTNLGFASLSTASLEVQVELYRADGTSLGTWTHVLPPFAQHQVGGDTVFPEQAEDAFAVVTSSDPEARFVTYASVVDNQSNDPIFVQPLRVEE